jgi:hypothetical protein
LFETGGKSPHRFTLEIISPCSWNPDTKHFFPSRDHWIFSSPTSDRSVLKELQAVRDHIRQKEHKLRSAPDLFIGIEIMHQFAIDLLGKGTPAARIFETTISEE